MRETTIVAVFEPAPRTLALPGDARSAHWLEVRTEADVDPDWLRAHFAGQLLYSLRGHGPDRVARLLRAAERFDFVALEPDDLTPAVLEAIPPAQRVIAADLPGASPDDL